MRIFKRVCFVLLLAAMPLLMAQTGPTVFTPRLTVSPGPLLVTTGNTDVQNLIIHGTCTGCVGAANFANPTGTIGLTAVNGVATTGIRSDGAPPLSQAIVPTWTGIHTFDAIPNFNGGASSVSPPFTTDSNTVVTNLNADMLDGISSGGFAQLAQANIFTADTGQRFSAATEPNLTQCNTSAAANNQCVITNRIDGNGDYRFVLANDSGVGVTNVIQINRTAATADLISLAATTITHTGATSFAGGVTFASGGIVMQSCDVTIPDGTVNDFDVFANCSPAGPAAIVRMTSAAGSTLNGIVLPSNQWVTMVNVGSQNIIFNNQNASSTATNRFIQSQTNCTYGSNRQAVLWKDPTTDRVRPMGYLLGLCGA